jgi:hypothetical protein
MPGYRPYKLEHLRNFILHDLGKKHFTDGGQD